jgi:hypothetical protein
LVVEEKLTGWLVEEEACEWKDRSEDEVLKILFAAADAEIEVHSECSLYLYGD